VRTIQRKDTAEGVNCFVSHAPNDTTRTILTSQSQTSRYDTHRSLRLDRCWCRAGRSRPVRQRLACSVCGRAFRAHGLAGRPGAARRRWRLTVLSLLARGPARSERGHGPQRLASGASLLDPLEANSAEESQTLDPLEANSAEESQTVGSHQRPRAFPHETAADHLPSPLFPLCR
jgi:hypothetical protein